MKKVKGEINMHDNISYDIDRIKDKIQDCNDRLNDFKYNKPMKKDMEKIIKKNNVRMKKFKSDIRRNKVILEAIDKRVERNNFFKYACGDKGIKNNLLDNISPQLTEYANEHNRILTNGKQYIRFTNKKQLKEKEVNKISIKVKDNGEEKELRLLSGGQRKTADLSTNLAFGDLMDSRINKKINFRYYDEPFDSLDNDNCLNACELINGFSNRYKTILVITHNNTIAEELEASEVTIKYKNGESYKDE